MCVYVCVCVCDYLFIYVYLFIILHAQICVQVIHICGSVSPMCVLLLLVRFCLCLFTAHNLRLNPQPPPPANDSQEPMVMSVLQYAYVLSDITHPPTSLSPPGCKLLQDVTTSRRSQLTPVNNPKQRMCVCVCVCVCV